MKIAVDFTAGVRQPAGVGRYTRSLLKALASSPASPHRADPPLGRPPPRPAPPGLAPHPGAPPPALGAVDDGGLAPRPPPPPR